MDLLIPAFVVCALVMLGMAVGVIFSSRRIKGTCGGLGAMSDDLGEPLCECGAREGEACGSVIEGDSSMAERARPVFDPLSTTPPPGPRKAEEVGAA